MNANNPFRLLIEYKQYPIEHVDIKKLKEPVLRDLKRHEVNGIIISVIILILEIYGWFLITQLDFVQVGTYYSFNIIQKRFSLMAGYYLIWLAMFFMFGKVIHTYLFIPIIEFGKNRYRKIKLTADYDESFEKAEKSTEQTNEQTNEKPSEKEDKVRTHFGDVAVEQPKFTILLYLIAISVQIITMQYYLGLETLFPSIQFPNDRNIAFIPDYEYFSFIYFMVIYLLFEIFLELISIFTNLSRNFMISRELMRRKQIEILKYGYNEIEKRKNQIKETEPALGQDESEKNKSESEFHKEVTNELPKEDYSKSNIFNTPLEILKKQKEKELEYKRKLAYLKERERLLDLLVKEKYKKLYGKDYRKHLKESQTIRSGNKKTSKRMEIEENEDKLHGYSIVSADIEEKDSKKQIKKKIKKQRKEEKSLQKKTKQKRAKKEFDFR